MKYRKRSDGSLTTKSQLIAENSNTSLPKTWTADTLEFLGVDPVLASPKPDAGDYEVVVGDGVVNNEGNWVEAWKVQPMFVEYTDEEGTVVTVDEQIADYEAQKLQQKRQGMVASNEYLRIQLDQFGVYGAMKAAVRALDATEQLEDAIEDPEAPDLSEAVPYAIHWEYASTIKRLDPWVADVAKAAGITDEQLDDLFEAAAVLTY